MVKATSSGSATTIKKTTIELEQNEPTKQENVVTNRQSCRDHSQ